MASSHFSGPDKNYTAGKAAKHGGLYGHAQSSGVGRHAAGTGKGGRFFQPSEAKELNNMMAGELQARIVANMAARYKRPSVSTGRLLKVTEDPGNRKAGIDYFLVGIPKFLDQSQSKYWRTIEEGSKGVWSHPFIGTPLPGRWGASKAGMYENRWGTVLRGGPTFSKAGAATGGKFVPFGGALRDRILAGGKVATVKHEIAPMHAYQDAWNKFGRGKRVLDDYLALLERESIKRHRAKGYS